VTRGFAVQTNAAIGAISRAIGRKIILIRLILRRIVRCVSSHFSTFSSERVNKVQVVSFRAQ